MGCSDDSAGTPDASDDAGDVQETPDVPRDTGPMCDPACSGTETCCLVDGEPTCIDVQNDPANCGLCGHDCSDGRGTYCEFGECVCGLAEQGCAGNDLSLCCPPRVDGGPNYCANLLREAENCGGCGIECPEAIGSACDGGNCICGEMRTGCEGTPESTCCVPEIGDTTCVDLTSDAAHCGQCNLRCPFGAHCENSICTEGEACTDCGLGGFCCNGECCAREACTPDGCMASM